MKKGNLGRTRKKRETTRFDGYAPNSIGYSINQSWGALKLCWLGYRIAKREGDKARMVHYAKRIRKLQAELDIAITEFPDIGLHGTSWQDVDLACE
jgi:hypothetical protein